MKGSDSTQTLASAVDSRLLAAMFFSDLSRLFHHRARQRDTKSVKAGSSTVALRCYLSLTVLERKGGVGEE